jgi:hypothetical protein
LMLPRTDAEFEDFELRARRRAIITARAENAAQIAALPGWAKVIVAAIVLLILGFCAFWVLGASNAGFFDVGS